MTRRSRALRRRETPEEALLWHELRNRKRGYKIRRQQPIGHYVVDFFCDEARIAIELDGAFHNDLDDELRDAMLSAIGVKVLRFENERVRTNLRGVLEEIDVAFKRSGWRSAAPLRGRQNATNQGLPLSPGDPARGEGWGEASTTAATRDPLMPKRRWIT